jgi:hypothetical protein
MRTAPVLLLALSACVTAESFPKAAAKASCDRQVECLGEASDVDLQTCQDDFEAVAACFVDNCDDFDAKAANDCLDTLRSYDCSGGSDLTVCFESVYTSCSTLTLGACILSQGFGG